MPDKYIIIFITTPSKKEAGVIVSRLLAKKLVACGNIIAGVDSHFVWNKKIENAKEVLLILKTKHDLFKQVIREVEKHHSYKVPEIIALPIIAGNKKYLEWIEKVTIKK